MPDLLEQNTPSSEINGQVYYRGELAGRVTEGTLISGQLLSKRKLEGYVDEGTEINGQVFSKRELAGSVAQGTIINGDISSPSALTGQVTIGSIIEGVSPTVSVIKIDGGYELSIVDINGVKTFTILHGTDGQDGPPGEIDDVLVATLVNEYLTEHPPVAQVNNVIEF